MPRSARRPSAGDRRTAPRRAAAALALSVVVLAGCSAGDTDGASDSTPDGPSSADPAGTPDTSPQATPPPTRTGTPTPAAHPLSLPAMAEWTHRGDRLTRGAVREQTAAYTSYDVSYRSTTRTPQGTQRLRVTGVLNVPSGPGPFPAVVLAHGYIDPAVYVRGQGMTRERGRLAEAGFVALHVDYRNHAGSSRDPRPMPAVRLGYTSDVVNAVKALQASTDVAVRDDRIALFGRSMGGGVVQRALVVEPGLVRAGVGWASVSSLEPDNFRQFVAPDPEDAADIAEVEARYGLPGDAPRFWRGISPRPYFDRITEPVLMVHGRLDDTCPPRWAVATQRAMERAGTDSRLRWYDDGHAFGPAFEAAMADTVDFLREAGLR